MNGGAGNDKMTGGGGADTFAFSHGDVMGEDKILDFNVLEGDRIDLSQLLFGDPTSENLADYVSFEYAGNNPNNVVLRIDRDTAVGADDYGNSITVEGVGSDYDSLQSMIDDGVFIL